MKTAPNKLTAGDRVGYAAKFLRNTGQFAGASTQRRGTFVSYWKSDERFARVRWDDFDYQASSYQWGDDYAADAKEHGQCVLEVNIEKVGSPLGGCCEVPQTFRVEPLTRC